VAEDPTAFVVEHTLTLGVEPELLRKGRLANRGDAPTNGGDYSLDRYLAVDRTQQIIVGTCAFTALPDGEGVVEIAYFTFPSFEGRGYASAIAAGLVQLAEGTAGIRRVRAHTLPEGNASVRILEKLGFERIGETIHPEAGHVWRWERDPATVVHRRRSQQLEPDRAIE
jgi:[ribosomal protein S5]-alanine N-acetyltransferase